MKHLLRLFHFEGYETSDVRISYKQANVTIDLNTLPDKPFKCYRCGKFLSTKRGQHRMRIKELSIMGMACFVRFWRRKGHCTGCKKARSEPQDRMSYQL